MSITHQSHCKKLVAITDYYTGEIACSNCGAVSTERVFDAGPEDARVSYEESRTGPKISLKMADMGLSSIIESKDKDAAGKRLSSENKRMFYRLRMWDRNSRYANSKSFQKAFIILDGISSKLGLPEATTEQAAHLFRKIAAKKMLAGRSTLEMLCATVYITCRLTDTPRTLQEIADSTDIKKKALQRTYRYLAKELEIRPKAYGAKDFVSRITTAADIPEKTERLAFKILDMANKMDLLASKNPVAMAAASVHLATILNQDKIPQRVISAVSGISSVTIRDRTREIRQKIGGKIHG